MQAQSRGIQFSQGQWPISFTSWKWLPIIFVSHKVKWRYWSKMKPSICSPKSCVGLCRFCPVPGKLTEWIRGPQFHPLSAPPPRKPAGSFCPLTQRSIHSPRQSTWGIESTQEGFLFPFLQRPAGGFTSSSSEVFSNGHFNSSFWNPFNLSLPGWPPIGVSFKSFQIVIASLC